MAERKITTKIEITGESEYKQAIKDLNSSLKLYNSELASLKEKNKDTQNSYDYLKQKAELLNKVQATQREKVAELSKALENAKTAQENYNKKVEDATKKVQQAETECEKLKNSVGENSDEYKQAKDALDKYNNELKEAQSAQEACGNAVKDWQTKLISAETQQNRVNSQIKTNYQYLKEARNSADGCATSIDNFGKKTKDAANKVDDASGALDRNAEAMIGLTNTVIATTVKEGFEAVYEAIKQCVEAATEFESSIAKLQTISGESPISMLSEQILEVSNATGIASSDLANTAYNAISASVAVSDAVSMAESASKLAIAGFTDTDSALSVLTTAINAYGDSAGTATEISDSLIQVQNLGVTTVAQLAANMGKAIATASAYGVNLSNLESAYISTTKAGINTAESTTYLSSMFKELGDDGSEVSKVIQEQTGMSFGKLMSSGESLANVLQMLLTSVNDDSEALMNLWGSAEAAKGANAILSQGVETFNKNLQTVQTSAGATETAYKTMADTSEMAGKRAANAFENLKIAVGERLTPVITEAQDTFADMTEKFTEFVKENPQIVTAIEAVAVGLGVFAGAVVAVNVATKVLIPLLKRLMETMTSHPIGLIVTAVASLAGAFVVLAANAEEADGPLKDYHEAANLAKEATDGLKESFENAEQTFSDTAGEIAATGEQAGSLVDRLEELSNKSNKTNDDIDEMSIIVTKLNTLYPELGLEINKATGELNKTNDELERYIENAKNAAMESAYGDKLTEESEAVVEAQKNLLDAKSALADAGTEYNDLVKEQSELTEKQSAAIDKEKAAYDKYCETLNKTGATTTEINQAYGDYIEAQGESARATQELTDWTNNHIDALNECGGAQEDATEAIETATDELEKAQEQVDKTTEAYEDYQFKLTDVGEACQDTFDETMKLLDGMDQSSEAYEAAKDGIEELTNTYLNHKDALETTYESLKEELATVEKQQQKTTESILGNLESQVGGLDAVAVSTEYTAEQIAANLKSQADYLTDYLSNTQAVMQSNTVTMSDTFKEFLTGGSEEAVTIAAAMNQAISEGNIQAAQDIADNYDAVQGKLGETSSAMAEAQGDYSSKIEEIKTEIDNCTKEMDQSDAAYKNTLKTFQYSIRAASGQSGPLKTTYNVAATNAANMLDKYDVATTYGRNNIIGAARGAESMSGYYETVYANIANRAAARMNKTDQQNSPSKRYYRHGRYNVEGAIMGVQDMSGAYVQAYADMATDAIDAYNDKMNELAPMAMEATEGIFGSVGDIDIASNVSDTTSTLINGISASVSNSNKGLNSKLNAVVNLLQKYLPDAGTTYLDGTLVSKAISKKITERQNATAKLQNAISGVR